MSHWTLGPRLAIVAWTGSRRLAPAVDSVRHQSGGVTMARLMYIGTHGPDDPTKACIPFHLAVNGAAEAGIEAEINLAGDAAVLIQNQYIETLTPLGLPPLRELLTKIQEKGVPIFV